MGAVVAFVDVVDFWEEGSSGIAGGEEAIDGVSMVGFAVLKGEEGGAEEAIDAVATTGFAVLDGEEKKEVMVALTFGFFAVEVAMSPALRLRGVAMVKANGRGQLSEGKGMKKKEYT